MIEVSILLDDIDYEALVELLLPLVAEKLEAKGGFMALLGRNKDGMAGVARQLLKTMSQEKRDEFLLQLLQEKKELALKIANKKADQLRAGVTIKDISACKVEE